LLKLFTVLPEMNWTGQALQTIKKAMKT